MWRARAFNTAQHGLVRNGRWFSFAAKILEAPSEVMIPYSKLTSLSKSVCHEFNNWETLATAMMHRSLTRPSSPEYRVFAEIQPGVIKRLTRNNEKLELVGDKVLGLLVATHLYTSKPSLSEGQISQIIGNVVSRKNVSCYCITLKLENYLYKGHSVRILKESSQPGNFLEALIGALFLDGGLPAAENFFNARLVNLLDYNVKKDKIVFADDSKRLLQEQLVASGLPGYSLTGVLDYVTVSEYQGEGRQTFERAIMVMGRRLSVGTGSSLVKADQAAAKRLLSSLKDKNIACMLTTLARETGNGKILHKAEATSIENVKR